MMYENTLIEVKISGQNRTKYENILSKKLTNGETIKIPQKQLLHTSRIEVLCKCDTCGEDFYRKRIDVKSTTTLCGIKCKSTNMSINNPNPAKKKKIVQCSVCNKDILLHESKTKQQYFLCSRECYSKHRSLIYHSDNLYNYQNIIGNCTQCHKEIKLKKSDETFRKNRFCSQECYWKHRSENYVELYYQENLNDCRPETKPEKKVREFLEENSIKFIQEYKIDKYSIDFYLTDFDVAIEVYGDYWHYNPDVFDGVNKKIHLNRQDVHNYDKKRNNFLETKIKKVYIIWENDININFLESITNIFKDIGIHP